MQSILRLYRSSLVVASCLLLQSCLPMNADTTQKDEFDALRQHWIASLVGDERTDITDPVIHDNIEKKTQEAIKLWEQMRIKMNKQPQVDLWPDTQTANSSAGLTKTANNLQKLAFAYATRGSQLYHDKNLLADVTTGLNWFTRVRYNRNVPKQYGNWWDWQIGVLLPLHPTLACLYDDLPPETLNACLDASQFFTGTIWATGANGIWRAEIVLGRSILQKNETSMAQAQKWMSTEMVRYYDAPDDLPQQSFSEGFYRDGSFFAHGRHPYNLGYGFAAFYSATPLVSLVAGSRWDLTGPDKDNIYHWFNDSLEPLLYRGTLFDNMRGREISRGGPWKLAPGEKPTPPGAGILAALLPLTEIAPEPYRDTFKSYAKSLIQPALYPVLNPPQITLAKAILADPQIKAASPDVRFKHFPFSARTSVLRTNFGASVAMYSDSVYNYEFLNNENLKGSHLSDGWLQIANSDFLQFRKDYWPTVNWNRLPGTTVVQDTTKPPSALNGSNWAGGASLDGVSGITGFELKPGFIEHWTDGHKSRTLESDGQTLTARKSWFFLGDEIICLGSGIRATAERPVETILENLRLDGAGQNLLTIGGAPQELAMGEQKSVSAQWFHLVGNVPGSDIGCVFPQLTAMQLLRESRIGSWSEINKFPPNEEKVSNPYITLWLDHGVKPVDASYAYTLLPGKTSQEVAAYAKKPKAVILSNTNAVQAVQEETLGLVGANFWEDAPATVSLSGKSWLSCDHKACIMAQQRDKTLEIGIADPTHANKGTITVTVNVPCRRVINQSENIRLEALAPQTIVTLDLSKIEKNLRAQTFKIKLQR